MRLTKENIRAVANSLKRFGENDSVPLGIAQKMIRDTAWWLKHPTGPVRAEKHYERVKKGPHGLQIDFGANNFLVGRAISRCRDRISVVLEQVSSSGERIDEQALRAELILIVCSAVSNYADEEYGFYNLENDFMVFGTQGINVCDFVDQVFRYTDLHLVCK
jgi:hypothetical protein